MKKIVVLFSFLSLFILSGCNIFNSSNDFTKEDFQVILNDIVFNSSECMVEFNITSSNANDLLFTYIISEKNDYAQMKKEINGVTEVNIIYKENETYFLYQQNNDEEIIIEISEIKKDEILSSIIFEQETYYTSMQAEDTTNLKKVEQENVVITYNEYLNEIYYENTLTLNDNKLVELKKVFTKDNSINTIVFKVYDNFEIEIPGGNI